MSYCCAMFCRNSDVQNRQWVVKKVGNHLAAPCERAGHSATLIEKSLVLSCVVYALCLFVNEVQYIFGGYTGTRYLNDMYILNLGELDAADPYFL